MKFSYKNLLKIVDVSKLSFKDLRRTMDEIGLEVKDIEEGSDPQITIEILANRGDHYCLLGVARELAAHLSLKLHLPEFSTELTGVTTGYPCKVLSSDVYAFNLVECEFEEPFKTTDPEAHQPLVDILNEIMNEIGQPMHVYDADKIEGSFVIRNLDAEEKFTALDGKEYLLPKGTIAICDEKKVIGAAGIIGGNNSKVTWDSKRFIFESATFNPVAIRKGGRGMGVVTDAMKIFERGADFNLATKGLLRVDAYLKSKGYKPIWRKSYNYAGQINFNKTTKVNLDFIREQLGLEGLTLKEFSSRLEVLGFKVTGENEKKLLVQIPSARYWDVSDQDDICEEYMRCFGLNRLDRIVLNRPLLIQKIDRDDLSRSKSKEYLNGNGFLQAITPGFLTQKESALLIQREFIKESEIVKVANALESNNACFRPTLLNSLCGLLSPNIRRGVVSIKLYEFGSVAKIQEDGKVFEEEHLGILLHGRLDNSSWKFKEQREDKNLHFKGIIEGLINNLGGVIQIKKSENPLLHPSAQGAIVVNDKIIGIIGEVHPLISKFYELKEPPLFCSLVWSEVVNVLVTKTLPKLFDLPKVWHDLTFLIPVEEQAVKVIDLINNLKPLNYLNAYFIDQFIKDGEKLRRITVRLEFGNQERTLVQDEVAPEVLKIVEVVKKELNINIAN